MGSSERWTDPNFETEGADTPDTNAHHVLIGVRDWEPIMTHSVQNENWSEDLCFFYLATVTSGHQDFWFTQIPME